MTLQDLMISKINSDFGGEEQLLTILGHFKNHVNHDEIYLIENMLIYFGSLFKTEVNVESDAIEYKEQSLNTIKLLSKHINPNQCCNAQLLVDLIQYKIDYVTGYCILRPKRAM